MRCNIHRCTPKTLRRKSPRARPAAQLPVQASLSLVKLRPLWDWSRRRSRRSSHLFPLVAAVPVCPMLPSLPSTAISCLDPGTYAHSSGQHAAENWLSQSQSSWHWLARRYSDQREKMPGKRSLPNSFKNSVTRDFVVVEDSTRHRDQTQPNGCL